MTINNLSFKEVRETCSSNNQFNLLSDKEYDQQFPEATTRSQADYAKKPHLQ